MNRAGALFATVALLVQGAAASEARQEHPFLGAGSCEDSCDHQASDCVDGCEARFKEAKPRVECKLDCAIARQKCEAACPH